MSKRYVFITDQIRNLVIEEAANALHKKGEEILRDQGIPDSLVRGNHHFSKAAEFILSLRSGPTEGITQTGPGWDGGIRAVDDCRHERGTREGIGGKRICSECGTEMQEYECSNCGRTVTLVGKAKLVSINCSCGNILHVDS